MLDFDEDLKLAQSAIRGWCAQHLEPRVAAMETGEALPYDAMREMSRDLGIADMARARFEKAATREDNGASKKGVGFAGGPMMAILMMELARVCPGYALAFGASLGLFGGAVLARGTPEQKRRWALPVLTMEKIGAWALTEPGAGSDAFGSMKTSATKVDGGYRLRGSKTFITNAPHADFFVVYARHEDDVLPFVLARGAEGLATGAPMRKMGMNASPTGEIFLDDVFVPDEDLVGGLGAGRGRAGARQSLANERFGMTPMTLGMVDRCLEESVRYAKQREQWGKPIASFQLVQDKIARMYTARTLMHALLMRQLEAEREGHPLAQEEASAHKLYCARICTDVAMEAVQLMGGAGYMAGSVVEMMARDAKLFQIGGGTDEIQILSIARALLERP